jgi:hypothetical protein
MRNLFRVMTIALAVAIAAPAWTQTAVEIKKELKKKYDAAKASGKDLGEAGKEYDEGDKALKDGLQEEAVAHFKKAKDLWPKE